MIDIENDDLNDVLDFFDINLEIGTELYLDFLAYLITEFNKVDLIESYRDIENEILGSITLKERPTLEQCVQSFKQRHGKMIVAIQ